MNLEEMENENVNQFIMFWGWGIVKRFPLPGIEPGPAG